MKMDIDKANKWLMLVGQLAILAGLLLVGLQIHQENELTKLQIFSDTTTDRIELHGTVMGNNAASVVMKSLYDPEELTLEELRIMDAYLLTVVNEARRNMVLAKEGLNVDVAAEENLLGFYFGNHFAQEWWKEFFSEGEDTSNEINQELDRVIRSVGDSDITRRFFKNLGERLRIKSTESL